MKTGTQFLLIVNAFTAFNTEDANSLQRNVLTQMANYLNATDNKGTANNNKPYKLAADNDPILKVDLPEAPQPNIIFNKSAKAATEVLLSGKVTHHNLDIVSDKSLSITQHNQESLIVGGNLFFNPETPPSKILAWAELNLQ